MCLRLASLALVLGVVGCESTPARPARPAEAPRRAGSPGALPVAPAVEGSSEVIVDAALPEPVAHCVARAREATPAVLATALAVLDERSFIEAACRLEVAVQRRTPRVCEAIHLSSLREVCRGRAAMAAGDPAQCPGAPGLRGRDPTCVAVAARDLGLCAAAGPTDRVRCEAIARGEASRCDRLDPLLREGCAREVAATRGLVPIVDARSRAGSVASAGTLGGADGGEGWSLPWVARGVFLDEQGALWVLDPAAGWPTAWAFGDELPRVALRVSLPGVRAGMTVTAEAALSLPHRSGARTEDGTLRAMAHVLEVPRNRGDRVRLRASLRGSTAGVPVAGELEIDSFVRDVVPGSALRSMMP